MDQREANLLVAISRLAQAASDLVDAARDVTDNWATTPVEDSNKHALQDEEPAPERNAEPKIGHFMVHVDGVPHDEVFTSAPAATAYAKSLGGTGKPTVHILEIVDAF